MVKILAFQGDKDGNAREEECVINFGEQPPRKHRPESHTAHASSSQDKTRPGPSSVQHKPTNHDRKDLSGASKDSKDARADPKHSHDHRKYAGLDKKDGHSGHSDKRQSAAERKDASGMAVHSEKKEIHPESHDKFYRKDGHSDKKDLHGERKDQLLQQRKVHPERREHGEHRERVERKPLPVDHRDSPSVKTEPNPEMRSHNSSNVSNAQRPNVDFELGAPETVHVKKEPVMIPPPAPVLPEASVNAEMRRVKSDQAIHYKDYLKRREQEKLERERLEKHKMEQEKLLKEKLENEKRQNLVSVKQEITENETPDKVEYEKLIKQKLVSDSHARPSPYGQERDRKHRPPKLDIAPPVRGPSNATSSSERDHNERPYEVNIKSPVKPHHNITVKSPIKSSDLKQPKLEITKVHLAPDKDGSDSCSVNINSDPNFKKMVETIKQEPGVSNSKPSSHHTELTKVKIKSEPTEVAKVKQERPERSETKVKVKQEPVESKEMDIDLNPEHSAPPACKIRELGYEPQNGSVESQGSLKISIKQEPGGSGRSTPIISQAKSESGSGSNTPIRTKIVLPASGAENSPLKLKISTKSLQPDLEQGSAEKYRSPHRHHKHKDKHKSHKHSKDREKHKERHREKHGSSSTSGTNGHPLKMSIKLSDIQGHSSSSNDSWVVKQKHDKHKHKSSVSETALNRHVTSEAERQQPWSMSDLLSKSSSASHGASPAARKRRRTPTVEVNNDISQSKAAKTDSSHSHRLRRSSSSHSVVSMEMSDGEEGHHGSQDETINQPQVVNQLHDSLQQMIDLTKRNVQALQQQQKKHPKSVQNSKRPDSVHNSKRSDPVKNSKRPAVIDRQQSGFDLEGMIWSGGASSDGPPLPPEAQPPLPKHPPAVEVPPPPPE